MNVVIFDFEVFKYDVLFGALVLDDNGVNRVQLWDQDEIINFYREHTTDLWVGHNNDAYDNHILYAILHGDDVFKTSKRMISAQFRGKAHLGIVTYDLMCCRFYSLKMTELLIGKAVHTSDVDFNVDRPLTDEEKRLTEDYNYDDLQQTLHNFFELQDIVILRLSLIKEFNIDKYYLTGTEARLAALALGAQQIEGLENQYVPPKMYDTLQIKNQDVINYYLSEGFRKVSTGENKLTVTLCGVPHQLGSGGIHGALKQCHETDIIYLDVSGYYNLVMINYDLLPRTIPPEGKARYEYMYHEQLRLKGVNDTKRWVYKTILLAVFGASMNEHTDFYDPYVGSLITITGQIFLVDLLEKLEGKVKLIQSNTDGIMVKPLPGVSDNDVLAIVKEWCDRTGFVIKPKRIAELYQRDVNNYCYRLANGGTDTKGDAFIGSWAIDEPVKNEFYTAKETAIVSKAVLAYLLDHVPVEETVEKYKNDLLYFQYLCKKKSYDYNNFVVYDKKLKQVVEEYEVDGLNRAFAAKPDGDKISYIMKYKQAGNTLRKSRIPNMPESYFIYNDEILSDEAKAKLIPQIDYQFYIDHAYERITEFLDTPIPQIKEVRI